MALLCRLKNLKLSFFVEITYPLACCDYVGTVAFRTIKRECPSRCHPDFATRSKE